VEKASHLTMMMLNLRKIPNATMLGLLTIHISLHRNPMLLLFPVRLQYYASKEIGNSC
jgi:hypothetical protein